MGMMASIYFVDNECSYPDNRNPESVPNNNLNNLLINGNYITFS